MIVGNRSLLLSSIFGWACLATPCLQAQDPAVQAELAALRKSIEDQKDQLARLANEVARLNALLDAPRKPEAIGTTVAPAIIATPGNSGSVPVPAEAPRPPVVPPPPVHIVVKGDSLDKIAKQHGVSIIDLQKLNKISDPKKLQIGQQLVLPPNADKGEKKDQPPQQQPPQ
jgi:LysM repeat protein